MHDHPSKHQRISRADLGAVPRHLHTRRTPREPLSELQQAWHNMGTMRPLLCSIFSIAAFLASPGALDSAIAQTPPPSFRSVVELVEVPVVCPILFLVEASRDWG